jgi:hypothetical protein
MTLVPHGQGSTPGLTFIYLRLMKKLVLAVCVLIVSLSVFSQNTFYYKGYTLRLLHPMNFNPMNDSVVFNPAHDTVFIYHLQKQAEKPSSPTHTFATVSANGVADVQYNLRNYYYTWSYNTATGSESGEKEVELNHYPTKDEILNLLPLEIRKKNPSITIYEKITEDLH